MDTHYELSVIAAEYESYFPECILMLETCFAHNKGSNKSPPSHIRITTQEGHQIKVSVVVAGWHVVGKDVYFDTFEALMNSESPAFSRTFASKLTGKLDALAKLQQQ